MCLLWDTIFLAMSEPLDVFATSSNKYLIRIHGFELNSIGKIDEMNNYHRYGNTKQKNKWKLNENAAYFERIVASERKGARFDAITLKNPFFKKKPKCGFSFAIRTNKSKHVLFIEFRHQISVNYFYRLIFNIDYVRHNLFDNCCYCLVLSLLFLLLFGIRIFSVHLNQ